MYESDLICVPGGLAGVQNAISATYFPIVMERARGVGDVSGAIATAVIGPLQWTRTQVSGPFYARRRLLDRSDEREAYVLMLLVDGGGVVLRDKASVVVAPGSVVFLNANRPLETEQSAAGTSLAVSFSAPLLKSRFVDVDEWCMVPLDATQGTAAILRECMQSYWRARSDIRGGAGNDLAASLVHLLGATFGNCSGVPAFDSRCARMHFLRVRDLIAENLQNPQLSVDFVSERLSISKSYLFSIMNTANTTLGRYILERRLDRSRELLADPALKGWSIGEIALRTGFQELSHFSRRFSERFGRSPRAFRAAANDAAARVGTGWRPH